MGTDLSLDSPQKVITNLQADRLPSHISLTILHNLFIFHVLNLDQAALFPREAPGTLPAKELEGVPRMGEAPRFVQASPRAPREMPHCMCLI